MAKYATFGIWDEFIKDLIEEISADNTIQLNTQQLKDFFYGAGLEQFCAGEVAAYSKDVLPILAKERTYPCITPMVVRGVMGCAWDRMRTALVDKFINAPVDLQYIYDKFHAKAIRENDDFYDLDATIRSGVKDYLKANSLSEATRLQEYYLASYKKALQETQVEPLKSKIQAHIEFMKITADLPFLSPKSKPKTPSEAKTAVLDGMASPLLPESSPSDQSRSVSSSDKPSTIAVPRSSLSGSFYGFFRKFSLSQTSPHTVSPPPVTSPRAVSV